MSSTESVRDPDILFYYSEALLLAISDLMARPLSAADHLLLCLLLCKNSEPSSNVPMESITDS